ncbi:MAG: hypothetical protein QGF09_09390, partial [Rhodospirillales bacterium]|nr:hypothetical protein [Rhodospirillales bacterium]
CRPIPRLRPSTRPAMPGSMNPWPSRIGKIIYRYIVAVVTKRRDFVRAANYFGPNRHRHSDEDYEGKERRKTDADLGEAEASKFEKEGGQRETLKFLD